MSAFPSVVLLNADAGEIGRWRSLLADAADLRAVGSVGALAEVLAKHPADVIVAPCDARLLDGIQRCRGSARLILCGSELSSGVIDAAAQGCDLRHVPAATHLRREVHALGRPRSLTLRHPVDGLFLRASGTAQKLPLLELSNGGFSFRLELDGELEHFLPGTVMAAVEIWRGAELALAADAAVVRYVEHPEPSGEAPFYRIGCELLASASPQPHRRGSQFTDRATRAGLLKEALRKGGIFLQGVFAATSGALFASGRADLDADELIFEAATSPFEAHGVVRGSFELGGASYSFVTSVIATEPLRLRLPSAIEGSHRRGSARYRPDPSSPVRVLLTAPLLQQPLLEREVLEVSSTGFSFAVDPAFDLFPPGMKLSRIELSLAGSRMVFAGSVKNLSSLEGGTRRLRCGVSFEGLTAADRAALADALMRQRYPGLGDGGALGFDEVWRFFQETRFLYPEKLAALGPFLPAVRHTFTQLHSRPSSVFKSLVYLENGKPLAHGSSVRLYRRTVVLQHLAGSPRLSHRPPPQILNLGLAEYLAQSIDLEYLKFYFRPDNKWPSRVFGNFARKLSDRDLSDLRTFDYAAMPTDVELQVDDDLRVVSAGAADLSVVERFFVNNARGILLRSDDLTRSALPLGELDAAFGELGLLRRRAVLLALRRDEPVGFALCELSSPGMNLSELLSAFRIHLLPAAGASGDPAREKVWTTLAQAALRFYREAGRPLAFGLFDEGEANALALPALSRKKYVCWTVHRSLCPRFCEHVDRLYELLTQGRRKKESGHDGVSDGKSLRGDAA